MINSFKICILSILVLSPVAWSNQVSLYSLRTLDIENTRYVNIKDLLETVIMDTGYRLVVKSEHLMETLNEPVPPVLRERHTMKIIDYLVYAMPDHYLLVIDDDNQLITYKTRDEM